MASPPSDQAIKTRIISHMNADHTSSLSRYLEAFAHASSLAARSPTLTDITLSSVTIRSSPTLLSGAQAHTVALSPPMSSLSEARPRLVELDARSAQILGREKDTVSRFTFPTPGGWAVIVGVIAGMVLFTDGANFAPGSLLARTLFAPLPVAARICERYHWQIWGVIMVGHVLETWTLLGRLRRWNVRVLSRTWWAWVVCQFFEGVTGLARFREETERVARVRREKEGKDGVGH